jgi:hypothetical protein
MECPKCGAKQDAGREECSSCGIVFARWQPRQPRKPTLSSTPVDPPAPSSSIPVPLIIVAAFIVVVVGLVWTRHHQAARAKVNPDDILNEINNKGSNLRRQLREEQAAMQRAQARAAMTASAVTQKLPADLDESQIAGLIQGCSYFSDRVTVDIPKKFQVNIYRFTLDRYPALPMAEAEHLIEFDPPTFSSSSASRYLPNPAYPGDTVNVKVVPYAYSKVDVSEGDDVYHFGLGRRRIEITRVTLTSESAVNVGFSWGFDNNAGANLAPEREDRKGAAEIQKTVSGWSVMKIWRNSRNSSTNIPCQ